MSDASSNAGRAPAASPQGWRGYFSETAALPTSYLFVLPALLLYTVGVNLAGGEMSAGNAVAEMFQYLARLCGHVNILNAMLLMGLFISFVYLKKTQGGIAWRFFPILQLETLVYGAAMVGVAMLYQERVLNAIDWSLVNREFALDLLLGVGAGVYEETFFRLILLSSLIALVQWASQEHQGQDEVSPYIIGIVVSALVFSLAHHYRLTPEGGLTLGVIETKVFVFRALCGVIFGLIFVTRGFAAAVYTHLWYDLLVISHNRLIEAG